MRVKRFGIRSFVRSTKSASWPVFQGPSEGCAAESDFVQVAAREVNWKRTTPEFSGGFFWDLHQTGRIAQNRNVADCDNRAIGIVPEFFDEIEIDGDSQVDQLVLQATALQGDREIFERFAPAAFQPALGQLIQEFGFGGEDFHL